MTELRRASAGRFSGALWGVVVAACGGLMIASFGGFDVDFQLAAIFVLCGLGLWLLLTALFASGAKARKAQRIAEPMPVASSVADDSSATGADAPDAPDTAGSSGVS